MRQKVENLAQDPRYFDGSKITIEEYVPNSFFCEFGDNQSLKQLRQALIFCICKRRDSETDELKNIWHDIQVLVERQMVLRINSGPHYLPVKVPPPSHRYKW